MNSKRLECFITFSTQTLCPSKHSAQGLLLLCWKFDFRANEQYTEDGLQHSLARKSDRQLFLQPEWALSQ